MTSNDTSTSLQARISGLEVELCHARRELDEVKQGAHFLLSLQSGRDAAYREMQSQLQFLQLQNKSLKDQLLFTQGRTNASVAFEQKNISLIDLDDGADGRKASIVSQKDDKISGSISYQAMAEGAAEWERAPTAVERAALAATSGSALVSISTSTAVVNSTKTGLAASTHAPRRVDDLTNLQTPVRSPGSPRTISRASSPSWALERLRRPSDPTAPASLPSCAALITGLPASTTYQQLTSRIRGGRILAIQLADTPARTGSMSAFVRFLDAKGAQRFVEHHQHWPLIVPERSGPGNSDGNIKTRIGDTNGNGKGSIDKSKSGNNPDDTDGTDDEYDLYSIARVQLVPTASYLLPGYQRNYFAREGLTRCFTMALPTSVAADADNRDFMLGLVRDCVGAHSLVRAVLADGSRIEVECTTIQRAIDARQALLTRSMRGYRNWTDPDPCEGPFERGMNGQQAEILKLDDTEREEKSQTKQCCAGAVLPSIDTGDCDRGEKIKVHNEDEIDLTDIMASDAVVGTDADSDIDEIDGQATPPDSGEET